MSAAKMLSVAGSMPSASSFHSWPLSNRPESGNSSRADMKIPRRVFMLIPCRVLQAGMKLGLERSFAECLPNSVDQALRGLIFGLVGHLAAVLDPVTQVDIIQVESAA